MKPELAEALKTSQLTGEIQFADELPIGE